MICLPTPDAALVARRAEIVRALRGLVREGNVIDERRPARGVRDRCADGVPAAAARRRAAGVDGRSRRDPALRRARGRQGRAARRGHFAVGRCDSAADGVVLGLGKFNRILDIDYANRCVVAQPGVTNLAISHAVAAAGFYYAPDPSSQIACTIGGNVAENSGGVHCLKYGLTTNNVLGVELVTPDGDVVRLGGKHLDSGGYDLLGLIVGSEGLLGRRHRGHGAHPARSRRRRARCCSGSRPWSRRARASRRSSRPGIIPAGMEMMDAPAIHAAEAFVGVGYPLDVEALLIVELDGPAVEVD